ncbi:MAG: hypothetical protein P1Q69_04490 [Candidatus Thorarchaeota archaeon]|nr:hypothetical protein [Candidatus Thorarchaeota archaeon]
MSSHCLTRSSTKFDGVDWAITSLEGDLFGVLDFEEGDFPHYINTATHYKGNKWQMQRSIELSIPLRVDFQKVLQSFEILWRMITPGAFRYCASARLTVWAMEYLSYDKVIVFDEYAGKKPWNQWLRSENLQDAIDYFSVPEISKVIADEAQGYYVNADQAQIGERKVRRYTYDDGEKRPLAIESPEHLSELVQTMGLCAFYTSVETLDNKVGRVCIDIDSNWLLNSVLGEEHVWGLQCALADAILHMAHDMDWSSCAVKFSGARGIHLFWEIEDDALGEESCMVDSYRNTLLAIDQDIGNRKTTEGYLSPFGSLRTMAQALVIHAEHRYMDWSRVPLQPSIIRTLGLMDPLQLIAIGKDIDQKDRKISVDIISQKKGVFRTTLSPHFKTGLVSIPIRNEFGQIGTEYRIWPYLRAAAEREQVMLKASIDPTSLSPQPGLLTRNISIGLLGRSGVT